jgi:leader peptidase (prepilin peptidase)/N-methyltransferase
VAEGLLAWRWPGLAAVIWIGLAVGSFLNVVIHRLPIMLERQWRRDASAILELHQQVAPSSPEQELRSASGATAESAFNLMVPRSRCPHCKHTIRAHENIPVISWLALRGRCAQCRHPISVRYPVVELTTALLSVMIVATFGFTPLALGALVYTWALVALTGIDFDTQLLPDPITLPLLWLGLILAGAGYGFIDATDAVIGAASGYGLLWTVYWGFRLATGKEGMGYGDFKLLAAIGAWLGWQVLPGVLLLAAASGLAWALALSLIGRRGAGQPIAFGPFLALGGWIALIARDTVVALLQPI